MTNKWDNTVKEILSKYFFDLSKLVFAALVLGGVSPIFTETYFRFNWYLFFVGITTTFIFAAIGYKLLKR